MIATQVSELLTPKLFDIPIQEQDVKECLGCQERELTQIPGSLAKKYYKASYEFRTDLCDVTFKTSEMRSDKKAIVVKHPLNHPDCYHYTLTTFPIFYDSRNSPEPPKPKHHCKGHEVLIDKFVFEDRASKIGLEKVKKKLKQANIKEAYFDIYEKGSDEATERNCFAAIGINKYALYLIFYHHDHSRKCPDHPHYVRTQIQFT